MDYPPFLRHLKSVDLDDFTVDLDVLFNFNVAKGLKTKAGFQNLEV